jgi:hypothetical protein
MACNRILRAATSLSFGIIRHSSGPGSGGYTYLSFRTHACDRGVFGSLLESYLNRFASEDFTLFDGKSVDGNHHGTGVSGDVTVLFENVVNLKRAKLRRQFVVCHDDVGAPLTGIREIFETF